jgi:hypothetical protein
MRRRPLPIALLVAVSLVAAGCGNKTSSLTEAQTEGLYMDVGPLLYQVQISRYLNPNDPEDRAYLTGLPPGIPLQPPRGQTWFGVFMRVQNVTKQTYVPTNQYLVTDTQGARFRPVPLNPRVNAFAYVPTPMGPGTVNPGPETPAANGPIQGSLILFRLTNDSLQNRPLVLHIEGRAGQAATIDLDL